MQQPDFNGISDLLINKTTVKSVISKPAFREMKADEYVFGLMKIQLGSADMWWELLCDSVRRFNLDTLKPEYEPFHNMQVTFYRDTLAYIECNSRPALAAFLKSKYPNYIREKNSYDSIYVWYNGGIKTFCTYENGLVSLECVIQDTAKFHLIEAIRAAKRADYIKNWNGKL